MYLQFAHSEKHFPRCGAIWTWRMGRFAVAGILLINGCQPSPNHRILTKGNITLRAQFKGGEATYRILEIPLAASQDDAAPDYRIQLPDGEIVALADLSVEELENLSHGVTDYDKLYSDARYPAGTKRLYVGGYAFWVRDGQLLKLDASTVTLESAIRLGKLKGGWEANVPRIGRTGEDTMYEMPFTHEEVIELFGEPDSIQDGWHT